MAASLSPRPWRGFGRSPRRARCARPFAHEHVSSKNMQASWVMGSSVRPRDEKRLAVDRVGVGGGDHVGSCCVHGGVNDKGRPIDGTEALDDLAFVIHQDEVRR